MPLLHGADPQTCGVEARRWMARLPHRSGKCSLIVLFDCTPDTLRAEAERRSGRAQRNWSRRRYKVLELAPVAPLSAYGTKADIAQHSDTVRVAPKHHTSQPAPTNY